MTFIVERLADLRKNLAHLEALAPRVTPQFAAYPAIHAALSACAKSVASSSQLSAESRVFACGELEAGSWKPV
jgi:hypothetical protein